MEPPADSNVDDPVPSKDDEPQLTETKQRRSGFRLIQSRWLLAFLLADCAFIWCIALDKSKVLMPWVGLLALTTFVLTIAFLLAQVVIAIGRRFGLRQFQFRLRTLFIFTLICATACALLVNRKEQKRKEREVVEAIVKLGGKPSYDYEFDVASSFKPPGPDWIRSLLGENFFSDVVGCSFYECAETEDALAHVNNLPKLQWLIIDHSKVTDDGLANLRGLTQIQGLYLTYTKVDDAGMSFLADLATLERLMLKRTNVTDAGLSYLEGLAELRELDLFGTSITDGGLRHLERLTRLQKLGLFGTRVSDAGIEHLKGLICLESLDLDDTDITGAGLKHLRQLTQLRNLGLCGTKVDDEGLACLRTLSHLGRLRLMNTSVTDAGMAHLKVLPMLDELWISNANISDAAVDEFKKARPNCTVYR